MKPLAAFLRDGRRAQHGGVLSGVLIMTAFVAIIAGALMSEISTNFLLSADLTARIANEATVDSAAELAFDSIQNAPLVSACPSLTPAPMLNGKTAVATYVNCSIVVDAASLPAAKRVASSSAFATDGIYSQATNEYLVADASGRLYGFTWGQQSSWTFGLGISPTAPPAANAYGSGAIDMVPTAGGVIALTESTAGQRPIPRCFMATAGAVGSQPAISGSFANTVYVGDAAGVLYVFNTSCQLRRAINTPSNQPVVAGPLALRSSSSERVFVLVSNGLSSTLLEYQYDGADDILARATPLSGLPAQAAGMAVDTPSVVNGARIAITFSGGQVALVSVSSSFNMSLIGSVRSIGGTIGKPPTWCVSCAGGAGLIGVGGTSGLYLYDGNSNLYASYTGAAISAAPAVDSGGDWFAAGSTGNVYELLSRGQSLVLAQTFPAAAGQISSSPILRPCGAALCIYFGSLDSQAYLIPLDARDATLSACISNSQGACSGANPRLWTQVEIGNGNDSRAVRVQAFSYYSP